MKILVGSKNSVKIEAVKEAFEKYFHEVEVIGFSIESNVPVQPFNDETFFGAENRTLELKKINEQQNLNADYFTGIEGGISKVFSRWFAYGVVCIMDKTGKKGFGTSAHFELPEKVIKEIKNGKELGDVMDEIQNEQNTKQKKGAIGYFTNGKLTRKDLYVPGKITALIPLLHKEYFE
ncbi:MAG: inosine/xanthosine triphosphatase [Bacteroidetes bacterium]|nr:inosine/xanthosine triphosphatase [Bacteroidota bacterium]